MHKLGIICGSVLLISLAMPALADVSCTVNAPDGELNVRDMTASGPGKVIGVLKNGYPVTARDTFYFKGQAWTRLLDGKTKSRGVGFVFRDYLNCNVAQTKPADSPQPSTAGIDGNKLTQLCTGEDSAYCAAYVRAAADTIRFWQYVQPDVMTACIPVQADAKQIVDVVMKYLRDSPQDRHNAGAVIVAMAAMNAWPCKSQGKPS
jgi:opacity protein-like surface antigen